MLVKINIDNEVFVRIKELIDEGKYPDLYHFIEIAINNQVQEETSEAKTRPAESFDLSGQEAVAKMAEEELSKKLYSYGKQINKKEEWQKKLKEIKLEESEIQPEKEDLIWSFHNRFLPVKIVVRQLSMAITEETPWIELGQLQEYAYDSAVKISQELKTYEDKFEVPRNQKLSTGLPLHPFDTRGLRVAEKRRMEKKLLSSKIRFMEQFVGRKIYRNNRNEFEGAGFSMGLIAVKFIGNTCNVSLTNEGREFALFNNPILDGEQKDVAFFPDEVDFIKEKIIPRYRLENIIVKRILSELKTRSLSANDASEIFKDEKEKYLREGVARTKEIEDALSDKMILQERVSTMGRLSELGLVKWTIDPKGQSIYTLKTVIN